MNPIETNGSKEHEFYSDIVVYIANWNYTSQCIKTITKQFFGRLFRTISNEHPLTHLFININYVINL